MKFGLDIHGVITDNPKLFAELSAVLVAAGHEVHIITGPRFSKVKDILKKSKIKYTHFFSIVEEEERKGKVDIKWDKNGDPYMDFNVWDRSKANYCKKNKIDLHIDDSQKYLEYFKTPYSRYIPKKRR